MADQTPLDTEAANPVRFAIRAARLTAERTYAGITIDNVELDVQGRTAEEVERLLAAFWAHLDGRQSPEIPETPAVIAIGAHQADGSRNRIAVGDDLNAIRHRMVDLGINQADLADKIGVNPSRVSLFLRGRENLSSKSKSKLLHALGLDRPTEPRKPPQH